MQGFQRFGGFDKDAVFCALASTHHDGYRCGQAQRTGAGDHQNRHAGGKCPGDIASGGDKPHHSRKDGDADNGGHKDTRHLVCQLGNGCLGGGGFLHQPDHLSQSGVLTDPESSEGKGAGFVDGSSGNLVARIFFHWEGFAGKGGFIHGGVPVGNHAVHRDASTGAHHHQVVYQNILYRDLYLSPVPEHGGGFGCQIHQPGNGLAGLALGASLKPLAQGDEGKDHTGRLEVQIHGPAFHTGYVSVAQAPCDLEQSGDAIYHGGSGAQGDEGIHIGGPMPEGFEPNLVVLVIDIQDGQGEQELDKGHHKHIAGIVEEGRQGPAHHMSHGEIEQRDQKDQGGAEAPLHTRGLSLHGTAAGSGGLCSFWPGQGSAISRALHGLNDMGGIGDAVLILHQHGIAQQIYVDLIHTSYLADSLFYMG